MKLTFVFVIFTIVVPSFSQAQTDRDKVRLVDDHDLVLSYLYSLQGYYEDVAINGLGWCYLVSEKGQRVVDLAITSALPECRSARYPKLKERYGKVVTPQMNAAMDSILNLAQLTKDYLFLKNNINSIEKLDDAKLMERVRLHVNNTIMPVCAQRIKRVECLITEVEGQEAQIIDELSSQGKHTIAVDGKLIDLVNFKKKHEFLKRARKIRTVAKRIELNTLCWIYEEKNQGAKKVLQTALSDDFEVATAGLYEVSDVTSPAFFSQIAPDLLTALNELKTLSASISNNLLTPEHYEDALTHLLVEDQFENEITPRSNSIKEMVINTEIAALKYF